MMLPEARKASGDRDPRHRHSHGDTPRRLDPQQNSDVKFRLFDWDRVDPAPGKPRDLQLDEALACVVTSEGVVAAVLPVVESTEPVLRKHLSCSARCVAAHGTVPVPGWRGGEPRVLVSIDGPAEVADDGHRHRLRRGEVFEVPAVVAVCVVRLIGKVTVLGLSLPEGGAR